MTSFASASVEEKRALLVSWVQRLNALGKGMNDGSSWKAGVEGGDWNRVLAKAQATLFDKAQKGIARQLTFARSEVKSLVSALKAVCEQYDMMHFCAEVEKEASDAIVTASVTISEARLLQFLKDPRMTAMIKKTNIQEEIDSLVDNNLASDAIENCIYEKALEVLKS